MWLNTKWLNKLWAFAALRNFVALAQSSWGNSSWSSSWPSSWSSSWSSSCHDSWSSSWSPPTSWTCEPGWSYAAASFQPFSPPSWFLSRRIDLLISSSHFSRFLYMSQHGQLHGCFWNGEHGETLSREKDSSTVGQIVCCKCFSHFHTESFTQRR